MEPRVKPGFFDAVMQLSVKGVGVMGGGLVACWFGCTKLRKKVKVDTLRNEIQEELARRSKEKKEH